jgi:hypothetical protein
MVTGTDRTKKLVRRIADKGFGSECADMSDQVDKEFLYRKLAQARRLVRDTTDPVATEGLKTHIGYIERQLAEVEARETDAPPEPPQAT